MVSFVSAASLAVASLAAAAVAAPATPQNGFITPLRDPLMSAITAASQIKYNMGAPVITAPLNLYYIYYGDWSDSQKAIVEDFSKGLGDSAWYGITKEYYFQESESSPKVYVDGKVTLAGTVDDDYSLGKSLSGNALPNLIQAQIDAGKLPEDTNAVYVILTAGDVSESIRSDLGRAAFCQDYCGYHVSWQMKSGKRLFYSMVGNPTACLNGCAPSNNQNTSPNGDLGVDALLSVLAHEITEAVTDPWSDGTRAWEDGNGYENADKCGYNYGTTNRDANGATFNVNWSGRNYMIQQNWSPISQSCRLTPADDPKPTTTTQGVPSSTTRTVPTPTGTGKPTPTPTPKCDPSNWCCQIFGFDC